MGWFSSDSNQAQAYQEVVNSPPKAKLSHELLAGAASYEADKAYENHIARYGKPESHAKAKELLAGFTGAFIDREVETKGLDYVDKREVENKARGNYERQLASGYQGGY
ncbi:hypothetical protein H0H93_008230 [Arthromyces matolae]|nr:hypothetical protein H0H93_008230 [Arthromyces matolae]